LHDDPLGHYMAAFLVVEVLAVGVEDWARKQNVPYDLRIDCALACRELSRDVPAVEFSDQGMAEEDLRSASRLGDWSR
jgi:hypothetical protein